MAHLGVVKGEVAMDQEVENRKVERLGDGETVTDRVFRRRQRTLRQGVRHENSGLQRSAG